MEATVELLTAEVRVLMVGSRQVTLSVARQLDHVGLSGIEPFGRVRIGDSEQVVIGRSRKDGTLVLSTFNPHPMRRVPICKETTKNAGDGTRRATAATFHAAIVAWEAAIALDDHAAALPLIVLAGLR